MQIAVALEKINFLRRFGPLFRQLLDKELQDKEVLFTKEKFFRGHQILTQGEANEYIYLVFKGKVKILLDAATLDPNNFCIEKE